VRVGIVGAGALGLVFADILKKRHELVLVCRRKQQALELSSFEATTSLDDLVGCEVVVLATKAVSAAKVMHSISTRFPDKPVVYIQNGLIFFEGDKSIKAVTTYAAIKKSDTESLLTGEGVVFLEQKPESKKISEEFNKSGLKTEVVEDINAKMWEKLFVNVAVNAVGAIRGVKNKKLLRDSDARNRMRVLTEEAVAVSGLDVNPLAVFDHVMKVLKQVGENKNSMLQDLEAGRKTEIDFLNGAVSQLGKELGLPTPENDRITSEIKALERRNN
jgi:2-dehydropantoate 2-reductase